MVTAMLELDEPISFYQLSSAVVHFAIVSQLS